MRVHKFIPGAIVFVFLISCGNKTTYEGDSMMNYPDMTLIMKDYLLPYEKSPNTFLKVVMEKDKKDSTYLKAEQMDWKEIHTLFNKANLYDSTLDKQYTITVISDTLYPVMTLLYTGIKKANPVQNLSIKADNTDSKINSIYWEISHDGFFSSEDKKILYVVGKTLQIQEFRKKTFSSAKKIITQYTFLN